jgi:hypothetical protein
VSEGEGEGGLGAGEVKLIVWALRRKEKGNIYITYNCIQLVILSSVGEGTEWK